MKTICQTLFIVPLAFCCSPVSSFHFRILQDRISKSGELFSNSLCFSFPSNTALTQYIPLCPFGICCFLQGLVSHSRAICSKMRESCLLICKIIWGYHVKEKQQSIAVLTISPKSERRSCTALVGCFWLKIVHRS